MTAIPAAELEDLAAGALRASGLPAEAAADVARVLVLADLFGIHAHGVARVAQYVERARLGGIDLAAEVETEPVAPAVARVDGRNGIGPVMPYLFLAAQDGFAAFVASNATTTMAPWGGREARLGNNPLGLGVPNPGADPILLDAAKLLGDGLLGARVEDFAGILHGTPPADPDVPVQVPGERELAAYRARLRDGIELPDEDLAALRELS